MLYDPLADEETPEDLLATVEKVWPRHLLDTITMTSFERQDGNVYDGIPAPKYSILSYTWGRFQDKDPNSPRLGVNGISWQIPPIDQLYFTVASFKRTIDQIRRTSGNRFLWLDVACIDQENDSAKMEEVGRQTGIFANAAQAFVWLWTIPTEKLKSSIETIATRSVRADWPSYRFGDEPELEQDRGFEHNAEILARYRTSIDTILDDYWFSSLWTLQEQGLRRFAVVLSHEAEPMDEPGISDEEQRDEFRARGNVKLTISDVTIALASIFCLLGIPDYAPIFHDHRLQHLIEHIQQRLTEARYELLGTPSNPNVFFGQASSRQVTVPLDRIYGIMGLYNIRVGATVDGSRNSTRYTLKQLHEEFVLNLNSKSAHLGQLFIHKDKPDPGKSWKITQNSIVPQIFVTWDGHSFTCDDCSIAALPVKTPARIRGRLTSFRDLVQFWHGARDLYWSLLIRMDEYVCREHPIIPLDANDSEEDGDIERIVTGLVAVFGYSKLSVIHLGGHKRRPWLDEPGVLYMVGLLIVHQESDRGQCHRVGLCQWYGPDHPRLPENNFSFQSQWEIYEGKIN